MRPFIHVRNVDTAERTTVAAMSNDELLTTAEAIAAHVATDQARLLEIAGEIGRRRAFEDDGATSLPAWILQRLGTAPSTARAWSAAAERIWDLPQLAAGMANGELTLDKLMAVLPVATPENDAELRRQARHCTVRQLRDIAAAHAPDAGDGHRPTPSEHDGRYLRCNDQLHTIAIKMGADQYAESRSLLEAEMARQTSDGETRLDQRLCDAFLRLLRGRTRVAPTATGGLAPDNFLVVLHAPLSSIADDASDGDLSDVGGELERAGLLDRATVRRVACDGTIVLGLDDDLGHTMYEGRATRFATPTQRREIIRRDRHCRFPGCSNAIFTNVHHLTLWKDGGRTDIDNMVLLCEHHHHTIHRKGWRVSGDANQELTFVPPNGRTMSTRPSPQWNRVVRR
jgi:hypothetical protein